MSTATAPQAWCSRRFSAGVASTRPTLTKGARWYESPARRAAPSSASASGTGTLRPASSSSGSATTTVPGASPGTSAPANPPRSAPSTGTRASRSTQRRAAAGPTPVRTRASVGCVTGARASGRIVVTRQASARACATSRARA